MHPWGGSKLTAVFKGNQAMSCFELLVGQGAVGGCEKIFVRLLRLLEVVEFILGDCRQEKGGRRWWQNCSTQG